MRSVTQMTLLKYHLSGMGEHSVDTISTSWLYERDEPIPLSCLNDPPSPINEPSKLALTSFHDPSKLARPFSRRISLG